MEIPNSLVKKKSTKSYIVYVSFSVICFAYNGQICNFGLFVTEPYGAPLNLIGAPQSDENKITLSWTPNIMDAPDSKNLKVHLYSI